MRRATAPRTLRILIPVLAGVLSAGAAVSASAATLGGIGVHDLGAAQSVVESHESVNVTWASALSGQQFVVDGITVSAIGTDTFVAGERAQVALVQSSGVALCQLQITVGASGSSFSIARSALDAACGSAVAFSSVDRIAVAFVR